MAWHPFRNPGLKITAILLGVLLWATVSGRQIEQSARVPLEYRNVPAGLEITDAKEDTVYVHLRGSDSVLARLEPGDVRAVIDLTDTKAVEHGTFSLRTDQIAAPYGVEVMWVDPPQVALTLEAVGFSTVPIQPAVVGKPAPGYVQGTVVSDPMTVQVTGPMSRLRLIHSATTEAISIDGATGPVSQTVGLGVADAALRLSDQKKARVTVNIVHAGRGGGR